MSSRETTLGGPHESTSKDKGRERFIECEALFCEEQRSGFSYFKATPKSLEVVAAERKPSPSMPADDVMGSRRESHRETGQRWLRCRSSCRYSL